MFTAKNCASGELAFCKSAMNCCALPVPLFGNPFASRNARSIRYEPHAALIIASSVSGMLDSVLSCPII